MKYVNYAWCSSKLCVASLLVILTSPFRVISITQIVFKTAKGFTLSQGTQLKTVYSDTVSAIFCSTVCSFECGSATYSVKYRTCITFVEKFYDSSVAWSQDQDWELLYRDEPLQYGDWTLVFRAQKLINVPMYDVWTATGQHDDSPLSSGVLNGCYRLDNLGGCQQHIRSSILDQWSKVNQVKLALYVNGSEVGYIVFNGTSTTQYSWFEQELILESSWPTIKNDTLVAVFTMPGQTSPTLSRRFFIAGAYGTCYTDKIYFLAVDKTRDNCEVQWSVNTTNFPVFFYSKIAGLATLSDTPKNYLFADVMAVFVKF
ncbi:hypothetical protein Btru_022224 [Bulinus truncatus]|nr:hypothetical protein Btru_022224 [Bulinus truncatus]